MKGLWFHGISNDNLLCYSRRDETTGDTVIVVVCLDSHSQQWGETDLFMPALGLDWNDVVEVTDELSGEVYHWGQRNAVGLGPALAGRAHPAGSEPVDPGNRLERPRHATTEKQHQRSSVPDDTHLNEEG